MRRWRGAVLTAGVLLGAVLGVAEANKKPPLTPRQACDLQCTAQYLTCKVGEEPDIPSLPGDPNPNASEEACKEQLHNCSRECAEKFPNPSTTVP
jgi:hypothetical protein